MENQQLSNLRLLCRNAVLGDGYLWKHPECKNYKIIFTSTNKEWLLYKKSLLPDIFPADVKLYREQGAKGCYKNSKPLYRLASVVHPVITEYANANTDTIISELTKQDIDMWFMDDGCILSREYVKATGERTNSKRYVLCIGKSVKGYEDLFLHTMTHLFNTTAVGRITLNNSKASENNKSWQVPVKIGRQVESSTTRFKTVEHKCARNAENR